jgi:hypothetical protein
VSVEPNSIKAFFEAMEMLLSESLLFEIAALFGFTLTFVRGLSASG